MINSEKVLLVIATLMVVIGLLTNPVLATPGFTDKNGCHAGHCHEAKDISFTKNDRKIVGSYNDSFFSSSSKTKGSHSHKRNGGGSGPETLLAIVFGFLGFYLVVYVVSQAVKATVSGTVNVVSGQFNKVKSEVLIEEDLEDDEDYFYEELPEGVETDHEEFARLRNTCMWTIKTIIPSEITVWDDSIVTMVTSSGNFVKSMETDYWDQATKGEKFKVKLWRDTADKDINWVEPIFEY